MLVWLLACAHTPIDHEVEPADMAALGPTRLEALDPAEKDLADAQSNASLAEQAEVDAARDVSAAEAALAGIEADIDASKAEMKAAEVNRDKRRRDAARDKLNDLERELVQKRALLDWKEAALVAAEANTAAARALVDVRHAQLEFNRVKLLEDEGRADDYRISEFLDQLADARGRWERAEERAEEMAIRAEEQRREYEDVAGRDPGA